MNAAKQKVLWMALVAALASGQTFAASTVEIEQVGSRNSAVVEQSAVPGSYASVYQNGTANEATVSQSNSTNPMEAYITTFGGGNSASIIQDDAPNATATIFQEDSFDSDAAIGQTHISGNTTASIVQRQFTIFSSSSISQFSANGSSASVVQEASRAVEATINQSGDRNAASILQVARVAVAQIDQSGSNNSGTITQAGESFNIPLNAYISQVGNADTAVINQLAASDSRAAIFHLGGSLNYAEINQTDVVFADTVIGQTGDQNRARVTQEHGRDLFHDLISQGGNYNEADIYQTGDGSQAEIHQFGDSNRAGIVQTGDGSARNHAFINQFGAGFVANIVQTGGGNSASVIQLQH